jgi:hypothetical protein
LLGSPWQRISRGSTLERDKALMITQSREEPNSQFSAKIRSSLFILLS